MKSRSWRANFDILESQIQISSQQGCKLDGERIDGMSERLFFSDPELGGGVFFFRDFILAYLLIPQSEKLYMDSNSCQLIVEQNCTSFDCLCSGDN